MRDGRGWFPASAASEQDILHMGTSITILFILIAYLSLADFYPALQGTRYEVFIAAIAFLFSVPGILAHKPWRLTQAPLWLGVLVTAMLSSIANHWVGGALVVANNFIVTSLVFFLIIGNFDAVSKFRRIIFLIAAVGIFFVVYGTHSVHKFEKTQAFDSLNAVEQNFVLVDRFDGPDEGSAITVTRLRALGTLNDPNDLAQFLLVCIVLLWMLYEPNNRTKNLLLVWLPSCVFLYGIFLTHSRGSLVALAFIALMVMRKRVGSALAAGISALMALSVFAIGFTGGRGISSEEGADRLAAWGEGFEMLKSNPILGVGMGAFADNYEITAHNSFVLVFAELGLVGYFFWLGMIVCTFIGLDWVIKGEVKSEKQTLAAAPFATEPVPLFAPSPAAPVAERDEIVSAARVVRLALIAFFTAAWFLSRSYVMTLYILLGIAASLILMEMKRHPERAFPRPGKLLKYTAIAEFASIIVLYMMIRFGHFTM